MNLRRPALTVASLALIVSVSGCSAVAAGHGRTDPTGPASTTVPAAASAPATPVDSATPATSDEPSEESTLRCAGTPRDLVDCLSWSLSTYWRSHLPAGTQTGQDVLLDLPPADGDRCVENARVADGPFTCTTDGRLFLPPTFQRTLARDFDAAHLRYAYASVLSHEYGHYLQLRLDDPTLPIGEKTQAQSRSVEQQADCLSGVWAHDAATSHGYDAGRFDATTQELIRSVSSNAEISTHGTPDDRVTALDRGLGTGRPSSCGLAGLR